MPKYCTFLTTAVICLLFASQVLARKQDKPKTPLSPAKIVDVKINLVPVVTAGMITGDAVDILEFYGGDEADKILYGYGLSIAYYIKPRYAVTGNIQRAYKTLPGDDTDPGRGWLYAAGFIYNLRTLAKSTPYGRIDIGLVASSFPRPGSDLELGTHPYLRLGLGMFSYTSGKLNLHVEAYFTRIFSKGHVIADLSDYEVDFDGEFFGLEFGMGVPLSTR